MLQSSLFLLYNIDIDRVKENCMRELVGQNGVKIVINAASMLVVKKLRKCIASEFLKVNIDIGNPKKLEELKREFEKNISKYINDIKNVILGLELSDQFEDVMWQCLKCCTYDNKQIVPTLFDDIEEARADYDYLVIECLKENLTPFFGRLTGVLSMAGQTRG